MSVDTKLALLELEQTSKVLTDPQDELFKEQAKRWSDIDIKTPAAIIMPATEIELQKTFVVRGGGHSEWSTVADGVVIDLTLYSSVTVDAAAQTATLTGGVQSRTVGTALAERGFCTTLGNGNTVGAIGYFLGGGASITTSVTGFGAQQIVSARVLTADGGSLDVREDSKPELLWALRGAGQYFCLVTRRVIKILPLAVLGNDRGELWAGSFVFPLDRAGDVCGAMDKIMNDGAHATSGLMMVMAPPPAFNPALVIAARYAGEPDDAREAYKDLYDLEPLVAQGAATPWQAMSDARAAIGVKGDFKRFSVVGLHRFNAAAFLKTIDVWKALVAECPDAVRSAFNFQWDSRLAPPTETPCYLGLTDIRFWQNNLIWHTDPASRDEVDAHDAKCIDIMRSGEPEESFVDFVNGTRSGPIERRFRDPNTLDRLRRLKKLWDPKGAFTV